MGIWHWILTVTGSNNTTGTWYGFWSGFGSDLGEFAIVGGFVSLYRQNNCHAKYCWRIGRRKVEGTDYTTCRRHFPDATQEDEDPPTAGEIADEYHAARRRQRQQHASPTAGILAPSESDPS